MSSMDTQRISFLRAHLRRGAALLAMAGFAAGMGSSAAFASGNGADAATSTAAASTQQSPEQFGDIVWNPSDWEKARARQMAATPGPMAMAVARWQTLQKQTQPAFNDIANFITLYPGLPSQDRLQSKAEGRLSDEYVDPARLVSFFERNPPLTTQGQASYALALRAMGRPEATTMARKAWRGGDMSPTSEATLSAMFGGAFTPADHASRMDSLLWEGATDAASRQLRYVTGDKRTLFMARLAALQGSDPAMLGISLPRDAAGDPGWLYNRARQMRSSGNLAGARALITTAPALTHLPDNPFSFVREMRYNAVAAADAGDIGSAVKIALKANEAFAPGTDVSTLSGPIRDEYEKLFHTIGEKAMARGDAANASRMFAIYGASQLTAPARSKGFYFAGTTAAKAGMGNVAKAELEKAAAYPDQFYGQLALEKLGRPLKVPASTLPTPSNDARVNFNARPLVQASREVGRTGDWRTAVAFFKELGRQAETPEEFALIAELARETGRRDLAVIAGREASTKQLYQFSRYAFPRIDVPIGTEKNWAIIHAIARQESQFATDAQSHVGARGLMQLMPGTAREQAGKMMLSYNSSALIDDPQYNIRLGSAYFARMLDVFGGSYPLAIAAYNAGPGNVGKWLRSNGDPRTGAVDWVEWIEDIPFSETRRYVARVLENAAYYDALYPDSGNASGAYPLFYYMGKKPGQ
ncbi:lytic transglycosylase domain-containing protein [Croceicoccus mobilis]|uniref:Lytic transglycosylase n=1 Tax=Croceicoccus mobilis TaxID=1703339 RepID=A0A917DYI0_9SPHN|nr:lytic transglycosylase domain-containing protein [Croceicoccus mobilis]GGD83687.1 lytic transglycosylase [Croceicoccus mobilis]